MVAQVEASNGPAWTRATERQNITEDARSIRVNNISHCLPIPPARDELQRLSLTLNEMMDRLESAFRRIARFTADASHELRTPVGLIRSTAELASMNSRDDATYRAALQDNLDEAQRMTVVIEDLLMLARADSGDYVGKSSNVDVGESINKAFSRTRVLANAKQIHISVDSPEQCLLAHGDPDALLRLFLILVDNAIKYTQEGGQISATLCRRGAEVWAELRDTGIGISDDDLPYIFERFYRADKARTRDISGAGLGLAIAKCIAEWHNAIIEVESAVGRGSMFRVRFKGIASTSNSDIPCYTMRTIE
jgi:signal transduction histidine kinase